MMKIKKIGYTIGLFLGFVCCERPNTVYGMLEELYDQEAYQEIISVYTKSKAIFNEDALLLNEVGRAYHELGEYKKAIESFNRVIELDEYMSMAYSNRGLSEIEIGEYMDATISCGTAIKLDSENFKAYINRSYASIKLKKWDWALEDLQQATSLKGVSSKNMGFAYANLGTVYVNIGQDEKALEYTEKAISVNRKIPWAFMCLAYLKIKEQKVDEALQDIEEGLQLEPQNNTLLQYKGLLLIQKGQQKEGCELLVTAKHLIPDFEKEKFKQVSESIEKYCD